jgi:hypothetical protein
MSQDRRTQCAKDHSLPNDTWLILTLSMLPTLIGTGLATSIDAARSCAQGNQRAANAAHRERRNTMRSMTATEEQVFAVEAPEFTDSWHPMAHADVVRSMKDAAEACDLEVKASRYSLTKNGANLFGTLSLMGLEGPKGTGMELGFRNSLNKLMAIGVTAGTQVMVCSNMSFSGDFIRFRKHTGGLTLDELYAMALDSVKLAIGQISTLIDWQESMKEISLPARDMKALTYDAMASGAISSKKFGQYLDMHKEEVGLNGETLYAWHGAGTRACRDDSLFSISERTSKLAEIATGYITGMA